ncbi:cell division protein FtsQ/DivIB [Candidatus Poriferisocius sp.]|uniref:cell division protein FtsQ/DivIB n=1 Tax=Candidatus Poriferisocius sp. TaxID=3101276 RepID=UPI003B5C64B4
MASEKPGSPPASAPPSGTRTTPSPPTGSAPPLSAGSTSPATARPPLDPRIQARRQRVRSRRRLRLWIGVGLVVVLVAIGYGITQSPLLDVDEVEVIGAQRTGADVVLATAGIERGDPLLGLDVSGARRAIAALPWVDQVRSSRGWGGKVTFDVTEREAVAQVAVEAGWALSDVQGRVLHIDPAPADVPVVLVGSVPQPGGWLPGTALPLLEAAEALGSIPAEELGPISWVNGQVIIDLPGSGQASWGGRDDPQGKAVTLATFLAKVDLHCFELIDLSVPEFPVLTRIDDCS